MEENELKQLEKVEEVEEVKYILHKAKAPDIFTMSSIIGKIGINKFKSFLQSDDIKEIVKKMQKDKNVSVSDIKIVSGLNIFVELAQIVFEGMPVCEDDIYKLLSSVSNLSIEEVKNLDGVTFLEMLIEFFKENQDFIKAASKYVKLGN